MVAPRKCYGCQKEIISGKFYNFFTGKKGGKALGNYKDREFFCPSCAEKEQANDIIYLENLIKVEWEAGNQIDEEILKFEKKWQDFQYESSNRINNKKTNLTHDFIQKSKQEFEPYLARLDIVEKSFGGKITGCGKPAMSFYYLFSKSALDEDYRKEVVGPVIAEILGGNPNQEINTTNVGASLGVPGRTSGNWEINNKNNIVYVWNDGPERICRRIRFIIHDNKLALQACLRALAIKEKELTGQLPKPNQPDNDNQNNSPNQPPSPKPSSSNNFSTNQPNESNHALWISLSLAAFCLIGLLFCYLAKKKKKNSNAHLTIKYDGK